MRRKIAFILTLWWMILCGAVGLCLLLFANKEAVVSEEENRTLAAMPKLSVVIPVYYNAPNLPPLYDDLREKLLDVSDLDCELVFVDDGSGGTTGNGDGRLRSQFGLLQTLPEHERAAVLTATARLANELPKVGPAVAFEIVTATARRVAREADDGA